jgi:hypothetical protein
MISDNAGLMHNGARMMRDGPEMMRAHACRTRFLKKSALFGPKKVF